MPPRTAFTHVRLALCCALAAVLSLCLAPTPAVAAVDPRAAVTIAVAGQTLSWPAVSGVSSYVFVRKVAGRADQYSTLAASSSTPPALPGQTVRYSVRTNVSGSAWAREVSIVYPVAGAAPLLPPPSLPPESSTVPALAATGQTLSWTPIRGVSSYVLVRSVGGQADQTTTVNATSTTPAAVPGKTARYRVRTSVSGSAWSNEVSIAYQAATAPPAQPPPAAPAPVPGGFAMGVTAGTALSYELPFVTSLGARSARLIYNVGTSASSMASVMDQYARAGVRPLLCANFHGRLPTAAEAQNVAGWAAAYGPGGTFWRGKTYPADTAVTHIEFGNETSYRHQFADWSLPTYSARARTYAERTREAANAIRAANPNVGLLAIGDNAVNQQAWVVNMFRAVPNLGDLVVGWTIHPYGPGWRARMDSTISSTRAAGSRDLPLWLTEWGLSTDDGRCLDDNYGFDRCMTYAEAATTLRGALGGMQSTYGRRFGAFYLYQAHDQYASGTRSTRESYFGALQQLGAAKGAYTSEVRATLATHP